MILLDIGLSTIRTEHFDQQENDAQLRANLDLLISTKEQASVRVANYQQKVARYFNVWLKNKVFKIGDLILKKAEAS